MGYQIILARIFKTCGFLISKNKAALNFANKFKVLASSFLMFTVVLVYGQKSKPVSATTFVNDATMASFNQPQLTLGKNVVGTIDVFDNILMMDSVIFEISHQSLYKPRLLPKSFMDLKKVNLKIVRYDDKNGMITVKMYNMRHINNGNATHFYGLYLDKSIEKGTVILTLYANNGKKFQSAFLPINIVRTSNAN